MAVFRLDKDSQVLVLHFGGEQSRINAYTLASALQGIADSAKAANQLLNPGFEVEVVVEALSPGSFRTTLRTLYRGAGNLFSTNRVESLILGIIGSFIYEHTLQQSPSVQVIVAAEEVIIESGDNRVVVPRVVYDAQKRIESNDRFRGGLAETFRALEADPNVMTVGVSHDPTQPPPVQIPRSQFAALPSFAEPALPDSRELEEVTEIQIVRAILERSDRRWQFVWNGVTIAAPVLDGTFYDDFFAHRIRIAPGDALQVRLRIRQERRPDLGLFVNKGYEVVEVLKHIPRQVLPELGE